MSSINPSSVNKSFMSIGPILSTYNIIIPFLTGQVTPSDSLFIYPGGLSSRNFSFPSHMPVFLDELSDEAIANARSVCGNDSQCIYDFSQTGNEELAMVTMTTNQENEMNQMMAG